MNRPILPLMLCVLVAHSTITHANNLSTFIARYSIYIVPTQACGILALIEYIRRTSPERQKQKLAQQEAIRCKQEAAHKEHQTALLEKSKKDFKAHVAYCIQKIQQIFNPELVAIANKTLTPTLLKHLAVTKHAQQECIYLTYANTVADSIAELQAIIKQDMPQKFLSEQTTEEVLHLIRTLRIVQQDMNNAFVDAFKEDHKIMRALQLHNADVDAKATVAVMAQKVEKAHALAAQSARDTRDIARQYALDKDWHSQLASSVVTSIAATVGKPLSDMNKKLSTIEDTAARTERTLGAVAQEQRTISTVTAEIAKTQQKTAAEKAAPVNSNAPLTNNSSNNTPSENAAKSAPMSKPNDLPISNSKK